MSDPLRLINPNLHRISGADHGRPPGAAAPLDPNQPSFKDVLMDNIKQVNKLQNEATAAIENLQTGQRSDVEGVIAATQKADAAFRMLIATRNKVAQAFEEIKQLRT